MAGRPVGAASARPIPSHPAPRPYWITPHWSTSVIRVSFEGGRSRSRHGPACPAGREQARPQPRRPLQPLEGFDARTLSSAPSSPISLTCWLPGYSLARSPTLCRAQVLVEQELHATEFARRRSRAAANATAARMSWRVRSGKSHDLSGRANRVARASQTRNFAGTVAVDAGMTADDSRRECQSEYQKSSETDVLELPAKIWMRESSVGAA